MAYKSCCQPNKYIYRIGSVIICACMCQADGYLDTSTLLPDSANSPSFSTNVSVLFFTIGTIWNKQTLNRFFTQCTQLLSYTRCSHSHAHLYDLWTNTCGLPLVGIAHAFGTVSHACATKCEVWEGRQSVRITLKEFENVSVLSNRTEREDMGVSQDDHVLYLLCLSLLLSLIIIILDMDFTALLLHLRSVSLPISWQAPSSFFLAPITSYGHFDVATMRLLALLQCWER